MIIITNGSPFSKQEDEKGFITTDGGGGTVMGELGSPESLPEMERPPLRKIDMYIRPDCPCCSMTKRYTVAFLASIGKLSLHGVLLQASFQISNSPAEYIQFNEIVQFDDRRQNGVGGGWKQVPRTFPLQPMPITRHVTKRYKSIKWAYFLWCIHRAQLTRSVVNAVFHDERF